MTPDCPKCHTNVNVINYQGIFRCIFCQANFKERGQTDLHKFIGDGKSISKKKIIDVDEKTLKELEQARSDCFGEDEMNEITEKLKNHS